MSRLRILYHHRTRSRDGQSIHIDELIRQFREAGHEVIVVEPERVAPTKPSLKKQLLPKALYELLEFSYSFVEFAKLAAAAIRTRPQVLYERANVFMLSGAWTARLFRLPFLVEVNAPLARERTEFGGLAWPAFAAWTERAMWRSADRVLPVTGVLAREIAAAGVPASRIVVIPNGVDERRFTPAHPEQAKRSLGLNGSIVLGFVGYVREWHGLSHIVELLARDEALANVALLIIGDGTVRAELEAMARDKGISDRVKFTGIVPHERLPGYMSAIDIALQPEATPYASPLKLFEYMALGLPVVAPDSENIREILENGRDALLFSDHEARAGCIRRLARDEQLRSRLGANAAAKIAARKLTWRNNAERIAGLFGELLRVNHSAAKSAELPLAPARKTDRK